MAKRLHAYFHHLNRRAGQERANWEILTRLARRGWEIDLASFSLADWPRELPLRWHPVRGGGLPTYLARQTCFRALAPRALPLEGVTVTNGTDAPARVRIAHYVAQAALDLLAEGHDVLPASRSRAGRIYQEAIVRGAARRERETFPSVAAIVAVSEGVAHDLRRRTHVPESTRIDVIRHAADAAPATPTAKEPTPLVLLVGTLERKGIAKALRSLALVKDLPWRFVALGDGDIPRWQRLASELGLGDRVAFPGARPSAEWFARASILLLPTWYEPFGLVVTEAVAASCVPLASRESGALELWPARPDWARLSRDAADDAWAAALRRLLTRPDERTALAAEARRAFAAWTWEDAASAYERLFESVTG